MSFMDWIDERFPATKVWNEHLAQYYAPKNFNFWYFFGSLAMLVLVMQIVTGVWLAMLYKPSAADAFASVEYIMRDVDYGWLLRYLHSTGSSAFFLVVYLHMFRALIYGSHRRPRELLWIIGVIIYVAMMATAFMGYLLPWGQMSYWGAQVIVNLFAAFPFGIGEPLSIWIRGDYVISDATLNRFFALHFLLPFVLAALVFIHIVALHKVGSNNPDGVEIKNHKDENGIPLDGIPFHPYYTVKDLYGMGVFLLVFFAVVFFAPNLLGEPDNYIEANPLATPAHIVPEWYFMPYYAILRSIPHKLLGVIAMFGSQLILLLLPWIDRSPVKSARFRPIYKWLFWAFVVVCVVLGYIGAKPPEGWYVVVGRIATAAYFLFFVAVYFLSYIERPKPLPASISEPVLKGGGSPAGARAKPMEKAR